MLEPSVEAVNTEEENCFENLTIPDDYSDYDILEKEQETVSLNNIVWVEVKKAIWQVRVIQIPYSIKEEDSEHLKTKWVDSRKEERVLIKNVSIRYFKQRVSLPTQQYYNGAYVIDENYRVITLFSLW